MEINIKGDIIDDKSSWIYDWLGINYTSPKIVNKKLIEANGEDVIININSPGGDVFAASEIYTAIRGYNGNVNLRVTGLAASAGSVIAMAGHCEMSPTAQMMIHNVSSSASGDYRIMDKMSNTLKEINNTIANAYMCKTGMTREQALEIMNNETWLSATKAKELGLIDKIMFEDTNKIDLSVISNKLSNNFTNSFSSIPQNLIETLKNNNVNHQPIKEDKVDFFMKQNEILNQKKIELFQNQLNERRGILNENE